MFRGSWVSIGPPGGLREGLLVDFGSPLRSSVARGVVFEGQLDTPFGSKSHFVCFCEIDVPHAREAYFRVRGLQSGWQNPSWSNLQHGVVFFQSKKTSTDPEIAPGEVLPSRWMADTSKMSFPCKREADFLKTHRSRRKSYFEAWAVLVHAPCIFFCHPGSIFWGISTPFCMKISLRLRSRVFRNMASRLHGKLIFML